jgi:hypothetical protein
LQKETPGVQCFISQQISVQDTLSLDKGFCFSSILWGRSTSAHSQEYLAKFGYRSKSKIGFFWNPIGTTYTILWWDEGFFLAQFCQVSLSGRLTSDHSQEDLAKFGYRSKSEVEFFGNSIGTMYQRHARTYGLNMNISTLVFSLKYGDIWGLFPPAPPPPKNPSPFFVAKWGQIWPPKETNPGMLRVSETQFAEQQP